MRIQERDEWQRFAPIWHAVMAGLAVLTCAIVAAEDGLGTVQRYLASGLTVALAGWYAIVGVRGLRRGPGRAGPVYLMVAAPLTVGLFAAAPVGALMLFALYPHIWVMLAPRRAIVATVAVIGGVAGVFLWKAPADDPAPVGVFVVAGVSLVIALLLGLWIERIIGQSRRRAALLAELAAARAELATVSREAGVLAERERLAREIHDTLAQGFTSVLLLLEAIGAELDADPAAARRHLDRARDTTRENLAEARALVAALTPPDLTRTSLPEALRRLVERADAEPGLTAALSVTGTPRGLPAEHEVALLRAGQEALANVRRHAGASRVEVTLGYPAERPAPTEGPAARGASADRVSLRVCDDGCGFDPAAPVRADGYGLAGMRARASQLGGAVHVTTAPGVGVTVCMEIPVGDG